MPVLAGLLWAALTWIFRAVVIQFIVMGVVLVLVTQLMPIVINYVQSFVNTAGLSSVAGGLDPSVWFYLDFFALDVGAPLILSAYVARFLIRRIPFIG